MRTRADPLPQSPTTDLPWICNMAAKMLQVRLLIRQKSDALVGREPESDFPLRTRLIHPNMTNLPAPPGGAASGVEALARRALTRKHRPT